jgi:hypothetical protein
MRTDRGASRPILTTPGLIEITLISMDSPTRMPSAALRVSINIAFAPSFSVLGFDLKTLDESLFHDRI